MYTINVYRHMELGCQRHQVVDVSCRNGSKMLEVDAQKSWEGCSALDCDIL